jgi:molybdate transport system substrate-binding protein
MIKIVFVLLSLFLSLNAKTISIAAASNLSYVMDALTKEFQKIAPDVKVRVTLGSSSKLMTQIEHGAPYGIFMSADMNFPQTLYKDGVALSEAKVYAEGSLVLFTKRDYNISQGLKLLKSKNIKRIAIANPKTAPYGKAAFEALESTKLIKILKKKFVYGESISQTLSYTLTAADVGIVAKSALFTPKMKHFKKNINWIDLPNELYNPIQQGIVFLPLSKNSTEYRAFYNFILSKKADIIFQNYGYARP